MESVMNRTLQIAWLAPLALIALASASYAAMGMRNDAVASSSAKVTLVQAVAVAEQHAQGKAARAEYEASRHGAVYQVEVVSGAKVFDVKVDADQGTVISSVEDKNDHGSEHDEDND